MLLSISYYIMFELLKNQLKTIQSSLIILFIIVILILGFVTGIHVINDVPLVVLTSDVAVIGEVPIYTGLLSQLGIFLWSATAAICIYSVQFIKEKEHKAFIKASAFITIFLALDDAFMFHEIVFPELGIHQKVVFLGYGILMLFYLLKYYKVILQSDFILFTLAMGGFGLSLFIDNFLPNASPYIAKLAEDGFKFLGITFWLGYFARTCKQYQV